MKYSFWNPRKIIAFTLRKLMGTIANVSTQENVVALTFDDGPHPEYTPRLLEILKKHKAQATFFMLGTNAQRYPDIVRQVAEAKHAIGNHSWDHPSFPLISGKERRFQIRACARAIAPYGQKLFRPPYGNQTTASRLDVAWLGYKSIGWNIIALDWLDHDPNWMVDQMVSEIQPGSIILFHDALYDFIEESHAGREATFRAVNMLLECLDNQFRFITIPELLQCGIPQRQNWTLEPDIGFLNRLQVSEGEARRYS
jgi:peptidoglycan/xylan/chitin deacetylase (PgdA/CDA1 family)